MRDRDPHPEDLPWNDAPDDSEFPVGTEEPEPAEVVGEEGEERDTVTPHVPDPDEKYHTESLDERLAEEEPEAGLEPAEDPEAGELQAPASAADDVDLGEGDSDGEVDELDAEDAALHVRPRI